jgi:pimeloyl-ACP methyl ester carboxylesterase
MIMNAVKPARAAKREASSASLWKWGAGAAAAGAVLGGTALLNRSRAKRAERENPPLGSFITVDGVKLHYLERGEGTPLVLLHGNGSMIEDWIVSGLFDRLAETHRVIAFDRPGFGHSERPRSRIWTPTAQAALLAQALEQLDAKQALVVGHSFGTLVAVAMALNHPQRVSEIALLGGYFYPSARGDVIFASPPAIPVIGDVMRYTISPLLGSAMTPMVNEKIFHPAPVPEKWVEGFPMEMSLRPSQIRAGAAEAAIMVPAAAGLAGRLPELKLPVTIIAGRGDELVDIEDQSQRLFEALPHSRFVPIAGAGHMVHHTAPDAVIDAILGK